MKIVVATVAVVTSGLAFAAGTAIGGGVPDSVRSALSDAFSRPAPSVTRAPASMVGARSVSNEAMTGVVRRYCGSCHSADTMTRKGNLTLTDYNVDAATTRLRDTELMIRKMRANMMPPPSARRPVGGGDSLTMLVETLENIVDKAQPNAGERTFQRMNRREYEAAIRDLLGLPINAGEWLPLDQISASFDNIGDVQQLSPMLLNAYLTAADAIARIAVGDRTAGSTVTNYKASPFTSQHPWEWVEGTPLGTRGGLVINHNFPADGLYQFRLDIANPSGGATTGRLVDVDLSIDGVRAVAPLHYERGIERNDNNDQTNPAGEWIRTEPLQISAGPHKISVAFVRNQDAVYQDLIKPNLWSHASNGSLGAGNSEPARVQVVTIVGPSKVTGISDHPVRAGIFTCKPASTAEERPCAQSIMKRLARKAYRRTPTDRDVERLMVMYDQGVKDGGFEVGVRMALTAMLASPKFVYRIEETPAGVPAGTDYLLNDFDMASRLSFFLWGSIPDDELLDLAEKGKLKDKKTYEKQVQRMLKDPRAPEAMSRRFWGQWLRVQDLDGVHPDAFFFPDYSEVTAGLMLKETMMFVQDIMKEDKSFMELFTANYTFVNGQLADWYGIPNVAGQMFRKVEYPDETRRGIFGQGTYLVSTSFANRTSPVLRGKYVMEVLIGAPPPPPPPDVPDLEETSGGAESGKPLTTAQRMAKHRSNAVCMTCHVYIDPLGLAVDNFDVTGRLRHNENLVPVDTRGQLYDGTKLASAADMSKALVARPIPLVRTFSEAMLSYAMGRRVEDFDQPVVRQIAKQAQAGNYKYSSFVTAVANSYPFRYRRAEGAAANDAGRR
jgi:hypothetical protein